MPGTGRGPGLACEPDKVSMPGPLTAGVDHCTHKTPQAWGSLGSEKQNAELRGRHARRRSSAAGDTCGTATSL